LCKGAVIDVHRGVHTLNVPCYLEDIVTLHISQTLKVSEGITVSSLSKTFIIKQKELQQQHLLSTYSCLKEHAKLECTPTARNMINNNLLERQTEQMYPMSINVR